MSVFLDDLGVKKIWEKIKNLINKKQDILFFGQGLVSDDNNVSVSLPSESLTLDEYNSLSEEKKKADVQYIITDDNGPGGSGGDLYSTEEIRIGTWIDGKPLYRLVLVGRTTTAESDYLYYPNSISIAQLVNIRGVIQSSSSGSFFALNSTDTFQSSANGFWAGAYLITVNKGVMVRHNGPALQGAAVFVVIDYTKTTD